MYTPGTPNVFYNSKAEAATAEAQGKSFSRIAGACGFNPPDKPAGTVICPVNGTLYSTGDMAMKGLGFQFATIRGPNALEYLVDEWESKGISNSQIELLRKYLRYEMPLPSSVVNAIAAPGGTPLNSDRPDLGTWDAHRSGSYPMDIDGDGRRDLGIFDPPTTITGTGTFQFRLSSTSFESGPSVSFGVLGDVPIMSDYNADGCTDVGVWRTSGPAGNDPTSNSGHFVYCPSVGPAPSCAPPTCTSTRTAAFGWRDDVPIADARFHGAAGEIAVFRPSDGTFYWRPYQSGQTNGGFPAPTATATVGGARFGSVPLNGDYDDDGKQDPTLYVPQLALFEILRSGASHQKWLRAFPTELAPENNPSPSNPLTAAQRAAGFPLEGVGVLGFSRPSVYFPHDGSWYTMWDVANNVPPTRCVVGTPNHSFPVTPGPDRDNDWRTDFVLFRGPDYAGNGWLSFVNSANGSCTTARFTIGMGGCNNCTNALWDGPRVRVFGSADMTGDGKAEVVMVDPDGMYFMIRKSEGDYMQSITLQLGNQKSMIL